MFPLWVVERGEAVSFAMVAVVLAVSARQVAALTGAEPRRVEDAYWWGALLFLVAGRIAHVAAASPGLVVDLAVLVRFTDGLNPFVGAVVALGWVLWRGGQGQSSGPLWAATVAGLTLAAVTYDLACPVREACFGSPASPPFGFPMHGLTEPRLPTPVLEGIGLLVLLGAALRLMDRRGPAVAGWSLLASVAALRLAILPVTAAGVTAVPALALIVVALGAAVLAWRSRGAGATLYAADPT